LSFVLARRSRRRDPTAPYAPTRRVAEESAVSPYSVPVFDRLAWIDVVLLGWFALTAASVAWIAWDVFRHTPENPVIKWA
jgi:hypothetical protein